MYADPTTCDGPDWRGDPRQRLRMSVAVAALLVASLLSQLRMPDEPVVVPIGELLVNIVRDEPEEQPIAESVVEPIVEPPVEKAPPIPEPAAQSSSAAEVAEAAKADREWTDWDQVVRDTTAELAAQPPEPTYSVNPGLDRLREVAAVKFRPSEAPVERPIWENVETDLLGRKVLRSGDCYKVIDDPNVGSREAFEIFGQHIVICASSRRPPKELPWVEDVNARRGGLSRYAHPSVE